MSMRHKSILTLLRPSHARLFILVAVVLTCGSLTQALANGKARDHNSHIGRGWMAERDFGHGWGWDASVGFYERLASLPLRWSIGRAPQSVGRPLASSVVIATLEVTRAIKS
jgi:hypothetical protein